MSNPLNPLEPRTRTLTRLDQLPMDVVDLILTYDGSIKKRCGRYCDQLRRDDPRYRMVTQIPRPVHSWLPTYGGGNVFVRLSKLVFTVYVVRLPHTDNHTIIQYCIRSFKRNRMDYYNLI